jgi:protein tyrosine/serine phosphatase
MLILKSGIPAFQLVIKGILSLAQSSTTPATLETPLSAPLFPSSVAIHCTAGKDRTGVIAAVLLSFLGVEDDLIAMDYALTECLVSYTDEEIIKYSKSTGGTITPDGVRAMLSAR